jgi:hypothetical protein
VSFLCIPSPPSNSGGAERATKDRTILLSHSYQISFKVGVCHSCKLNLFLILSKLLNIITHIIIPLAYNLTLSRGPVMLLLGFGMPKSH